MQAIWSMGGGNFAVSNKSLVQATNSYKANTTILKGLE